MQITRGDSFLLALVAKSDGVGLDLTNWQVHSSIGTALGVIQALNVEFTSRATGEYTLSADTTLWPIGTLEFDIQYISDVAQKSTTDPVSVIVVKGITP